MGDRKPKDQGDHALRRLVSDVDRFGADAWGRRPERHHDSVGFTDLLSVEAVDRLLESARRPGFRVVTEGRTLSPSEYTKTVRMGGMSLDDAASPIRIADLFARGATLVMQGLERTHPPLRRFTRQLADELSHSVQANAYLSPGGGARGLNRHADEHDVFVLQVEGVKQWDVDGIGELTLRAGDVLYMPRGTQHVAHTDGAPSLHITIGVATATYRDVLRRAVDRVNGEGDTLLDQRLPLGFARAGVGASDLRAGAETAIAELIEQLQQLKPEQLVDDEQRRFERRRAAGVSLRPAFDAAALTLDTPIRTIDARPIELSSEAEQAVVDLDDRRIRMPLAALPALQHLVDRGTATPGELPELSDHSRLVVARRLIKEGALELVRPEFDDAED